jgi:hypothetical protein
MRSNCIGWQGCVWPRHHRDPAERRYKDGANGVGRNGRDAFLSFGKLATSAALRKIGQGVLRPYRAKSWRRREGNGSKGGGAGAARYERLGGPVSVGKGFTQFIVQLPVRPI